MKRNTDIPWNRAEGKYDLYCLYAWGRLIAKYGELAGKEQNCKEICLRLVDGMEKAFGYKPKLQGVIKRFRLFKSIYFGLPDNKAITYRVAYRTSKISSSVILLYLKIAPHLVHQSWKDKQVKYDGVEVIDTQ